MNPNLDIDSCDLCRACYRQNTPQCNDACRRCSIAMFSEDTVNIYPESYPYGGFYPEHTPNRKSTGRTYFNYPRVSSWYYPSMFPFVNTYSQYYSPTLTYY